MLVDFMVSYKLANKDEVNISFFLDLNFSDLMFISKRSLELCLQFGPLQCLSARESGWVEATNERTSLILSITITPHKETAILWAPVSYNNPLHLCTSLIQVSMHLQILCVLIFHLFSQRGQTKCVKWIVNIRGTENKSNTLSWYTLPGGLCYLISSLFQSYWFLIREFDIIFFTFICYFNCAFYIGNPKYLNNDLLFLSV